MQQHHSCQMPHNINSSRMLNDLSQVIAAIFLARVLFRLYGRASSPLLMA
ncbi:hypothetical protein [Pontibacter harenae]|nr:hypothetical protein [Pontibacter harenae]MCC9167201.1 hypothetical protein [Pontibacter harenae]